MKILIDGAGFIGEVHLNILLKYKLADAAICEVNEARLKEISKKYNIDECYKNVDEALEAGNFDGAVICTPNNVHAGDAIKFLKKGAGVLVEKPMTHTVEDAERMVEAAENNNTFIYVAYVVRHTDTFIRIKEMINKGELGELFSIRAVVSSRRTLTDAVMKYRGKSAAGGSVIHDYSHEIDYSIWFMGEQVEEIYCKGFKLVHKDWDTFDSSDIILTFKNDKTSSLHLDYIQPPNRRSIELYGTKGTLLWTDTEDIKFYPEAWAKWINIRVENFFDFDKPFLKQMQHYISCLRKESEPPVSGRDGLNVVKIINKCIESSEKGCSIRFQ